MLNTTVQRKINNTTVIDINQSHQSKITSNFSWSNYGKVGFAIAGTVGTVALANTAGFLPSFGWNSKETTLGNTLDNSHSLVNPQVAITFADKNLPILSRHVNKRASLGVSSEFQINTYTSLDQRSSSVAGLSLGDFVVVWESNGQDGNGTGIYGQHFLNTGIKKDAEFQINTYTSLDQRSSSVAGLSLGDFVVVWASDGQDGSEDGIYDQRFSNTGIKKDAEFQINTYTTNAQNSPSVAGLSSGDFVVVWYDDDRGDIYGQCFSNTGIKKDAEFQINTYTTNRQSGTSIAALTTGDFVVVWQSLLQDGSNLGIYGQRFSSTCAFQGSEFQINTYTPNSQRYPSVAGLSMGDFVVVWDSYSQDGDNYCIYGQRYSSTGVPQGSEFQINTYTPNAQKYPSVAGLSMGDFVVAWQSVGQDGYGSGIYGQRFSSTGIPQGNEFQVNTYTTSYQSRPSIAALTAGDFVVVWDSDGQDGSEDGIYGRMYFNNNMPPSLINHVLTINEAGSVILSNLNLSAYDPDEDSVLIFTISNVRYGQFERILNAGIAITSFTQQDIIDSAIQFVHDGSKNQPTYDVSVSDGALTDGPITANITFIYIAQNQLVIQPGEFFVLGPKQLDIQTQLAPTNLEIRVTDVQFGHFEKNDGSWKVTNLFSLSELNTGKVRFVHDGTENKPHYILQFKDLATNYTLSRQLVGNTFLNHPPELINPIGVLSRKINEDFSYVLPNNIFRDPDNQLLQVSVKSLNNMASSAWFQFDNLTTTLNGKPIKVGSFKFKAIATDPYGATSEDRFYIDVKATNSTTILGESINPFPIVVAIAGGAALLTGGIAAGIVYFKKAQDRKTRQQHEFARKIRHHLGLQKVDNFASEQGKRFIQAVAKLSDLLQEEQGIDITTMDENRLDELAGNIATAAKNKINPASVGFWKKSAITIQEFADNIDKIARDNQLFGHGDDVNILMHTIDNAADNNFGTLVEEGINEDSKYVNLDYIEDDANIPMQTM